MKVDLLRRKVSWGGGGGVGMQLHVLFGSTTFWLAMVAKILGCVLHGIFGASPSNY
jgi:hypothetical protein